MGSLTLEASSLFSKREKLEANQKSFLKRIYKAYDLFFKSKEPIEKWPGVKVNEKGYVVSLKFSFKQFNKPLQAEFFKLSELEKLQLHSFHLIGEIPKEISSLKKLKTLDLSNNKLRGKIPFQIGSLLNLEKLSLYQNEFNFFPETIGNLKNLKELYIFRNKLRKIPKRIKLLSSLEKVDFSNNQIKKRLKVRRTIKKANPKANVISGQQGEAPFYVSLWWSLW